MSRSSHWIQKTHLFEKDEYICSSCGYSLYSPVDSCPGCGANMRGSKYEASWVDEAAIMDLFFK